MIIIDTNALLRFFIDDIPKQAQKVSTLLTNEKSIFIPDVVFTELDYLLIKFYKIEKNDVLTLFKNLLDSANINYCMHITTAYEIYLSTNNSFSDCIIAAQSSGHKLASFDKNLLKIKNVKSYF